LGAAARACGIQVHMSKYESGHARHSARLHADVELAGTVHIRRIFDEAPAKNTVYINIYGTGTGQPYACVLLCVWHTGAYVKIRVRACTPFRRASCISRVCQTVYIYAVYLTIPLPRLLCIYMVLVLVNPMRVCCCACGILTWMWPTPPTQYTMH